MRIVIHRHDTRRGRQLAAAVLSAALAVSVLAPAAADAQEGGGGSVDATVTATDWPEACILLGASQLDFGELRFSRGTNVQIGRATVDGTAEEDHQITSCSTGEQGIFVAGTAATGPGGASWALDATPTDICADTDRYRLSIQVRDPATDTYTGGPTIVSTSNIALPYAGHNVYDPDRLEPGGSRTMRNNITMPCEGSSGAGTQMSLSIEFTAVMDEV